MPFSGKKKRELNGALLCVFLMSSRPCLNQPLRGAPADLLAKRLVNICRVVSRFIPTPSQFKTLCRANRLRVGFLPLNYDSITLPISGGLHFQSVSVFHQETTSTQVTGRVDEEAGGGSMRHSDPPRKNKEGEMLLSLLLQWQSVLS